MKAFAILLCACLTGCGPGFLAAATAISGVDAAENLLHDTPDLFKCDHIFGAQCAPDSPVKN